MRMTMTMMMMTASTALHDPCVCVCVCVCDSRTNRTKKNKRSKKRLRHRRFPLWETLLRSHLAHFLSPILHLAHFHHTSLSLNLSLSPPLSLSLHLSTSSSMLRLVSMSGRHSCSAVRAAALSLCKKPTRAPTAMSAWYRCLQTSAPSQHLKRTEALWSSSSSSSDFGMPGERHHQDHLHTSPPHEKDTSSQEMLEHVCNGTAFIIDVREPSEFRQGHIPSAVNVPLAALLQADVNADMGDDAVVNGVVLPNKESNVVLYCQAGVRSLVARTFLRERGWTNASNFRAGWATWASSPDTPKIVEGAQAFADPCMGQSKSDEPPSPPASAAAASTSADNTSADNTSTEGSPAATTTTATATAVVDLDVDAERHLFHDLLVPCPDTWAEVPVGSHFSDRQWSLLRAAPMLVVGGDTTPQTEVHPVSMAFLLMRQFDKTTMPEHHSDNEGVVQNGYELYFVDTEGGSTLHSVIRIGSHAAHHLLLERGDVPP